MGLDVFFLIDLVSIALVGHQTVTAAFGAALPLGRRKVLRSVLGMIKTPGSVQNNDLISVNMLPGSGCSLTYERYVLFAWRGLVKCMDSHPCETETYFEESTASCAFTIKPTR